MRVLVITSMYPPHHLGGYELACRDAVQRWRAGDHDVEVLTTTLRLPDRTEDAAEESLTSRRLEFYWRDHEIVKASFRKKLAIERANQNVLAETLARFRPDVVSAWHMGGMSLGLLTSISDRRLPLVCVVHDLWPLYGPLIDGWTKTFRRAGPVGALVGRVTGLPTRARIDPAKSAVCYVSDFVRRTSATKPLLHSNRVAVVPCGINGADFRPAMGDREWRWRLICVGRVEERKGVHVAIEALAQLPAEANLEIVGPVDATYGRRLDDAVGRLNLEGRVRFTKLPREELADHYADADAFVFPVVWDEPFGLTPLEAMACGTPVVGSATGGSREFLLDGVNSLRTEPGDSGALAAALRKLAADEGLRKQLVTAGRATAAYLNIDRMAQTLEEWHIAAANHFADGTPAPQPDLRSVVENLTS